jgi:acyl-CoA synthetase (AMP-forming)/AMP-acid ligase II
MGRIKFEINKAGMKINPEDIDILLESNTHVNEACAFGLSDPIVGETVAVAISPRDSAVFYLDSLKTWCSDNLVHEKVPEKWFILEEIPKTDRGKINRNLVAEVCLKKK